MNLFKIALCSGQGFAGVFAVLAYIINLAAAGSPSMAGVSFFCTAAVVAFLALVNHFIIIRNKFYVSSCSIHPLIENSTDELEPEGKADNDGGESAMTREEIVRLCAPDIYSVFISLLSKFFDRDLL